ncbi:MAG: nucleotidyltransferase [Desulfurococcaceae archaeon]
MSYSISDLARVLRVFSSNNVKFTIIGDTCIQIVLGKESFINDIDLFIIEPSIFDNERFYMNLAISNGWEYSYTEIGTPRLIANINGKEIVIELYENYLDIDIPESIINKSRVVNINDLKIRILYPEQYLVLKARQGVDLDKLKQYVRELKQIDYKLLKETIDKYPEDERKVIIERLEDIGLYI